MKTYSINSLDSEHSRRWMWIADVVRPQSQDSGRTRYIATVREDWVERFESSLDADNEVMEYNEVHPILAGDVGELTDEGMNERG